MIQARYHLHNAVAPLLQGLVTQFPDMSILTDEEHDFVLDLRETLVLARKQFRESVLDFEAQLHAEGLKRKVHLYA